MAGFSVQNKQRYDGSKQNKISYTLGNNKKISLTQSTFKDVQNAIREHVAKGVPFTECMSSPEVKHLLSFTSLRAVQNTYNLTGLTKRCLLLI